MRHTHCMLYVFNLQRYNFLLKLPHKKKCFLHKYFHFYLFYGCLTRMDSTRHATNGTLEPLCRSSIAVHQSNEW